MRAQHARNPLVSLSLPLILRARAGSSGPALVGAPTATATPAQAGLWAQRLWQLQCQTCRHGRGPSPAPATPAQPMMRAWRLRPPRSWRPGAGVRPPPTTSPPRAYSPARPVRRRLSLRPLPYLPLALFVPPHRATSKVSILARRGRRRAPWRLVSPPQLMARGRGDHTLRIQYSTAEC